MQSLIQRVPSGSADLLGIRANGQNPNVLGELVQASLDMNKWYLTARWEDVTGQPSAIALVGLWGLLTWRPSPGELWVVDSVALTRATGLAAATSYRLRLCIADVQTGALKAMSPTVGTATVGEIPTVGWGDIIIKAGEQLAVWCEALTLGAAIQPTVAGRVARLAV